MSPIGSVTGESHKIALLSRNGLSPCGLPKGRSPWILVTAENWNFSPAKAKKPVLCQIRGRGGEGGVISQCLEPRWSPTQWAAFLSVLFVHRWKWAHKPLRAKGPLTDYLLTSHFKDSVLRCGWCLSLCNAHSRKCSSPSLPCDERAALISQV